MSSTFKRSLAIDDSLNFLAPGAADLSLMIFAIPKPFLGATNIHQRNAIGSWLRFVPPSQVLLCGNADGTAETADEFGLRHSAELESNDLGTPLVSGAFAAAYRESTSKHLLYVNADVILPDTFFTALSRLFATARGPFLALGRRATVPLDHPIDWQDGAEWERVRALATPARWDSILCKDYFVFSRGWFVSLPPFAVGRGNWDNWMVFSAKKMGMQVVDLTPSAVVIHPQHGHAHVGGGRRSAYVRGGEAKSNQRLAGGRHWIRGSTAPWELMSDGLRRRPLAFLQWPFWADWRRVIQLGRDTL